MDAKLLAMLNDILQYTSRLKTCLCIQLADHAAQTLGYRSSRQVDDIDADRVEDIYNELLNRLLNMAYEYQYLIEHRCKEYKREFEEIDLIDLEIKLEESLLQSVLSDDSDIFNEMFLE